MALDTEVKLVPLAAIRCNPHQPRHQWDDLELADLAASIAGIGIIHPPVVLQYADQSGYELVSGERRVRAARLAGLKNIPVLIKTKGGDATFAAQAALIENVQRVDLNPIEVARALRHLIEQFGYRQEQLATIVGKKRSTVANYLRLLALPENIQAGTAGGTITMGHAKAILALDNAQQQQQLYTLIVKQNLSVRAAEQAVARFTSVKNAEKPTQADIFVQALTDRLQVHLGTKVSMHCQNQGTQGRISIDYYSLEDLDRLLLLLGIGEDLN
jgi:ParB family chromosome partitioning protein